jgi:hypothetical protein
VQRLLRNDRRLPVRRIRELLSEQGYAEEIRALESKVQAVLPDDG